ncbi:glycoside hydrolase family protein [Paraburkholderia bannensis]|uniref:hypothetical protein n=1 Tax=Paraburkholderia bannensis TaxID=765414 RepID=UPI000694C978|nr:hypothetical protein [Paraburkholderia bannensis]
MARGIIVSFLGMFVMACSGCGGGGGSSSSSQTTTSAQAQTGAQIVPTTPVQYADGRPSTSLRVPSTDYGVVLPHGTAPGGVDSLGARDVYVYQSGSTYFMTYDGSGGPSWNTVLATSDNLTAWTVKGNIVPLGNAGSPDSDCVCYAQTFFDGQQWRMYYTTSTSQSSSPVVPLAPYKAMLATASAPSGPWTKAPGPLIDTQAGTYYADTASPGSIVTYQGQSLQFFSAGQIVDGKMMRTIGIARSSSLDGPWKPDSQPALPATEQIENAVVWLQQSTGTYFMFVDHIGLNNGSEIGDAAWVYWTKDPTQWNAANKAVVMDGQASNWSKNVIGIPSVLQVGDRLALFYDGDKSPVLRTGLDGNLNRDIGMAWINLPIATPAQ